MCCCCCCCGCCCGCGGDGEAAVAVAVRCSCRCRTMQRSVVAIRALPWRTAAVAEEVLRSRSVASASLLLLILTFPLTHRPPFRIMPLLPSLPYLDTGTSSLRAHVMFALVEMYQCCAQDNFNSFSHLPSPQPPEFDAPETRAAGNSTLRAFFALLN